MSGTHISKAQHSHKTLTNSHITGKKTDPIEDLILPLTVFEKVATFEVLILVDVDECVFEADGGESEAVKEELIERSGEGEVEVGIVFAGEVLAD